MPDHAKKDFDVLSFGEVMIRLSPVDRERIVQGSTFEKQVGGSELNVVAGAALLGLRSGIITKLPANDLGQFVKRMVRFAAVDDRYIIDDRGSDARLGLYFYENGVAPRKPSVVYDRAHSSITTVDIDEIPEEIYGRTELFHTSGITLALGEKVRNTTLEMIRRFKRGGAKISFDVNYRANLWSEEEARNVISDILPLIDILFVSEETSRRMFGKIGSIQEIMKSYSEEYGVRVVATTERKVQSPTRHTFGSILYSAEQDAYYTEKPYSNIEVVDRIGSGDAYVAGVISGLLSTHDYQRAVELGDAMSAVKNTVPGDGPVSDAAEIEAVIRSHKGIGSQDEMKR